MTFQEYQKRAGLRESMGDITPEEWAEMHPEDTGFRQRMGLDAPNPSGCLGGILARLSKPKTLEEQLRDAIVSIMIEENRVSEKDFKGVEWQYKYFDEWSKGYAQTLTEMCREFKPGTRMQLIAETMYERYVRSDVPHGPIVPTNDKGYM